MSALQFIDCEQGSQEWLDLRKTKITATDAPAIMGVSPWKTKIKCYKEKIGEIENVVKSERMQRGLDLEPIARELFTIRTGIEMFPRVVVRDWAMASLDGLSIMGHKILEIKCPGPKDHELALCGKIPEYYFPQLQHQMMV